MIYATNYLAEGMSTVENPRLISAAEAQRLLTAYEMKSKRLLGPISSITKPTSLRLGLHRYVWVMNPCPELTDRRPAPATARPAVVSNAPPLLEPQTV